MSWLTDTLELCIRLVGGQLDPLEANGLHDLIRAATRPEDGVRNPPPEINAFWRGPIGRSAVSAEDVRRAYGDWIIDAQRRISAMDATANGTPSFTPEAQKRAADLLKSHCTKAQWKSWKNSGTMKVTASSGAEYELSRKGMGTVMRIGDRAFFCLQVVGERVPTDDAALMRKLLLETNEPEFLRVANNLTERNGGGQACYGNLLLAVEEPRRARDLERQGRLGRRQEFHAAFTEAPALPTLMERVRRSITG